MILEYTKARVLFTDEDDEDGPIYLDGHVYIYDCWIVIEVNKPSTHVSASARSGRSSCE